MLYNPVIAGYTNPIVIDWTPFLPANIYRTAIPPFLSRKSNAFLNAWRRSPKTLPCISRVKKIIDDRRLMGLGSIPFDWGMAENLAYASLLVSRLHGIFAFQVRMWGAAPSFFTAMPFCTISTAFPVKVTIVPLAKLQEKQATFQCFDSILSEEAVLAFEYGYAASNPYRLVIWEAQFGDFANRAQVVIDQFIASGETKMGPRLRLPFCCCRMVTRGRA